MTRTNVVVERSVANGFSLGRRACPKPHGTEVLFAMQRAAICGTDRQIARGTRDDRARILGHEGVATVVATGDRAASWRTSARCVWNPVNPRDQDEIVGHSTDGLFQRYVMVCAEEIERRSLVVAVPDALPVDHCVLAEPLATVVYTHELLAAVGRPRSMLILGAGSMGLLHARYACRIARVPDVAIVCPRPERAEWLRRRDVVPPEVRIFDGASAAVIRAAMPAIDCVLFCVPARATQVALQLAVDVVAAQGSIGLVAGADRRASEALPGVDLIAVRRANACGSTNGEPFVTATSAVGKPVRVFGHRGSASRHVDAALAALMAEPRFARILTHRVSLAALPRVLTALAASSTLLGVEYGKAIVDCTVEEDAVALVDGGGGA